MSPAEQKVEAVARRVECPTCGVKPRHKCRYSIRGDKPIEQQFSHARRLELARSRT